MKLLSAVLLAGMAASSASAQSAPKLSIVQLQYGGGGDWYANPSGLPNLLRAIRERTGLDVADRPLQLKLTDPNIWAHPYLYMTGHGNVRFTEEEIRILRNYLGSGGFLHADDNYGMDESFRREIKRLFPDDELVELPPTHPIYHVLYDFPRGLPKVHQHDGKRPQGFGIIRDGRVAVFYSYETDLGNGWEDADRYSDSPAAREAALRMGVNLFLYAMSQVPK
ncbi:MAG: DUF4159 domain-containing protein [Gemmatimonadota bacterium]